MAGTILDSAVRTKPLLGHDGRSGATLERVVLADGRRLIVKRSSPQTDLAARVTGDASGRERRMWAAGVLDRLPSGVGHAIVDAWLEGEQVITVMRDLGSAVIGWRRISRATCRTLIASVAALHAAFEGDRVAQACALADRLGFLSPQRIRSHDRGDNPLPPLVLRGWERFAEIAPADVAATVSAIHADPSVLTAPLARRPATLVHGDLTLVNAAIEDGRVTLLDWGLATWGPPALELSQLLPVCASLIDASREEIIADFRAASGPRDDTVALRLALLAGVVDMGWNKALDATEHPDDAVRAREAADLAWWVAQARRALDAGLL